MSDIVNCESCGLEIPDDEDVLEMTVKLRGHGGEAIGEKVMEVCETCARQTVDEMLALQRAATQESKP